MLAKSRAAAARERVRVVRKRVAVATFSIFTAAWVGVFGQLVAGRDPALGDGTKASSTRVHRTAVEQASSSSGSVVSHVAPTTAPTVVATPLTTRQS